MKNEKHAKTTFPLLRLYYAKIVFPFESQAYEANTQLYNDKKTVKCANVHYAFMALYHCKWSLYH